MAPRAAGLQSHVSWAAKSSPHPGPGLHAGDPATLGRSSLQTRLVVAQSRNSTHLPEEYGCTQEECELVRLTLAVEFKSWQSMVPGSGRSKISSPPMDAAVMRASSAAML